MNLYKQRLIVLRAEEAKKSENLSEEKITTTSNTLINNPITTIDTAPKTEIVDTTPKTEIVETPIVNNIDSKQSKTSKVKKNINEEDKNG